jgi:L-amino acid N-acyltransferase YncA
MGGSIDLEVRRAEPSDWSAIWAIFRSVVATGRTYTYPPDISETDARATWRRDGAERRVTYVALVDGEIIGTALLQPNLPGLGGHVANAGWMIHPDHTGKGLGRQFAEAVIADAVRLGFTAMQFNAVVSTNEPAIRLWTSLGFGVVGTIPDGFRPADGGSADLLIMFRSLA